MVNKLFSILFISLFSITLHASNGRDTIADLNSMLGGVTGVKKSEKGFPNGFEMSESGVITVDTAIEKGVYYFELMALTPDESHFIVNIKYDNLTNPTKVIVNSDKIDMATGLRKDGMIWVVVLVSLVVFAGLISYLVILDRKVSKLEKAA